MQIKKPYVFRLNSNIAKLWLGQTLSVFGDAIFNVGFYWIVYKLYHSPAIVASVIFSTTVPYLIFGILGGAFSDKYNKKKIMLFCDFGRAFILFILGTLVITTNNISPYALGITGFILTSLRCFFYPSLKSSIPEIAKKEELQKVSAFFHGSFQTITAIGSAIGGILIGNFSFLIIVLINLTSFLVSIYFIYQTKFGNNSHLSSSKNTLALIKDGFSIAMNNTLIKYVVLLFPIGLTLIIGLNRNAGTIICDTIWKVGPKGLGLLLSFICIGNLIGSAFLMKVKIENPSYVIFSSWFIWGVNYFLIGFSNSLASALVFSLIIGLSQSLVDINFMTYIQKNISKNDMGRIFSIWSTLAYIGESASNYFTAIMIRYFSAQDAFIIGGSLCALFALSFFFFFTIETNQTIKNSAITE